MHNFRLMTATDIPAVMQVQRECYELLTIESEATIRARLAISPHTAWVAEDDDGVCAYLVACHAILGKVTPLDGDFTHHPRPNSLYLHDLAISARSKGLGMGSAMVHFALAHGLAEGLPYSSLVSVQESRKFWESFGYAAFDELDAQQAANLRSYPGPACYMVKPLQKAAGD